MRDLLQASAISPDHFAPFPLDRYEPLSILGAAGFGVTFLCRHRHSRGKVAVKSLLVDDMDCDGDTVLQEANTLEQVKHPALIGVRDCGFANSDRRRPFLVMEYFDGPTLEEYVGQKGALSLSETLALAEILAEGLQAAHGKRLLHRDVKPANVLLRKEGGAWEVRIIDFGLALNNDLLGSLSTRGSSKTIVGGAIAGTIDYAAPEQMGKIANSRVGPPADVFGYGRTLSFALFGTPEATWHHYKTLPPPVAEFLSHCVQQKPDDRPQGFNAVLKMLDGLRSTASPRPAPAHAAAAASLPDALPVEPREPAGSRSRRSEDRDDPPQRPREEKDRPRSRRDDDKPDRPPQRETQTTTSIRILHAVLAFMLGAYGVHKFAQGNAKAGVTRLLITLTCIGVYVTLFVAWGEAIKYLLTSNEDYHQAYMVEQRGWF
jgi:serine/threonine protein kinase